MSVNDDMSGFGGLVSVDMVGETDDDEVRFFVDENALKKNFTRWVF